MRFIVQYENEFLRDYNVKEFNDSGEVADYITEHLDDSIYDEMLDECYEEIDICGYKYSPSVALYRVDEIAYNCGKYDYYNSLGQDIKYEIDRMDDNEQQTFYGFIVTAYNDTEEEE